MLFLGICTLCILEIKWLVLGAIISFIYFGVLNTSTLKLFKPLGGYANIVSFGRLILLCFLFLFRTTFDFPLFEVGLIFCVLLDVLDGFLARRLNQTSAFGHYLDMEIDAFFVLIMCCYFYLHHDIGWYILVPGFLRYLFKLVTLIAPRPNQKEVKRNFASIIAGTFFCFLLLALFVDSRLKTALLLLGSILIVFSFATSFYIYFTSSRNE